MLVSRRLNVGYCKVRFELRFRLRLYFVKMTPSSKIYLCDELIETGHNVTSIPPNADKCGNSKRCHKEVTLQLRCVVV